VKTTCACILDPSGRLVHRILQSTPKAFLEVVAPSRRAGSARIRRLRGKARRIGWINSSRASLVDRPTVSS
jgi:hypothetical protein